MTKLLGAWSRRMASKRRVAAAAGVAALLASASLVPARAEDPLYVDSYVGFAEHYADTVADYATGLVGPMVPTSWVPSDPVGYAGDVVEAGNIVAGYATGLVGPMVPTSWVPSDPVVYAGDVAAAGKAYAEHWARIADAVTPDLWLPEDPVAYGGQAAEVGKAYAEHWAEIADAVTPDLWRPEDPVAYAMQGVALAQGMPDYVEGAADQHYGTGPFAGTITYEEEGLPLVEACGFDAPVTTARVAITAEVVFTDGDTTYAGPLFVSGTGSTRCGADSMGTMWSPKWTASGTDSSGNTLHCRRLGGIVGWTGWWSAMVFSEHCTLNGTALPKVQMLLEGQYAPTGKASGAVGGALWMNTY